MTNNIKKAIKLEIKRNNFAVENDVENFKSTYSKGLPSITNLNTSHKWNRMNKNKINESINPMAFDRIRTSFQMISGKNLNILDIGFGQGAIEEIIAKSKICDFLLGIDISSSFVNKMSRLYPNWKFVEGYIQNLRLPAVYFDYVLALEVFEHINPSEIFNVIKKINNALKIDGYLIVSIPLNENLPLYLEIDKNPNAHTRIYEPETIALELELSGFEIIKKKYLYAFHRFYWLKKIILFLFPKLKLPNNLIILAKKKRVIGL